MEYSDYISNLPKVQNDKLGSYDEKLVDFDEIWLSNFDCLPNCHTFMAMEAKQGYNDKKYVKREKENWVRIT